MKDQKIKFSLIVCTLGNRIVEFQRLIDSLNAQTFKNIELIVVSQANHDLVEDILCESNLRYLHVETEIRGLSRARNIGMRQVKGEIITISDDDCWYPTNAFENAYSLIDKYKSEFNVFCFKIFDPNTQKFYKKYGINEKSISWLEIGKCSSIEIFVLNNELSKNVCFDENFGLGSKYPSGEENIYLYDLLKRGNRIVFIPETIVYHAVPIFERYNYSALKLETVKRMFIRMFGVVRGYSIYLLFYLKHFKRIKS